MIASQITGKVQLFCKGKFCEVAISRQYLTCKQNDFRSDSAWKIKDKIAQTSHTNGYLYQGRVKGELLLRFKQVNP